MSDNRHWATDHTWGVVGVSTDEAGGEQWVVNMEDPPRNEWLYGHAVCVECMASPAPDLWFWYYMDNHGRCYCRECAPVTPDVDDDREQAGLDRWSA